MIRRSQASASDRPAPAATPLIAASTGFSISLNADDQRLVVSEDVSFCPIASFSFERRQILPGGKGGPGAGDHHCPHVRISGGLA